MSWYLVLKFVHILLAIVAVGFNASYGIWLARAGQNPAAAPLLLRGVKLMDDRFANPAYAFLLVTGLAMAGAGSIPLTTFWIAGAATLWVITMVWGLFMYTPALKKQIRALDEKGFESIEYRRAQQRARWVGMVNLLPVALILILMVFKPTF
jgi:uncharacterized membrane protein